MSQVMMYTFDLTTGEYGHSRPAQTRPDGTPITDSLSATPVAPPQDIAVAHVARWTGTAWEIVEDHRQVMDDKGRKSGGTAYWLPGDGDGWQSPERYMDTLGPLPDGAVTIRPVKSDPTPAELATQVRVERDRRISATDYLMAVDYPLSDEDRAAVTAYRQSLRDIPEQPGFPWTGPDDPACPWPVPNGIFAARL